MKTERILIFTSHSRDSEIPLAACHRHHIESFLCKSLDELFREIRQGVGVVILSKDVLSGEVIEQFVEFQKSQPHWSQIPMLVLLAAGDTQKEAERLIRSTRVLGNITLLDYPVRTGTLLTVINMAVLDRRRQYEMRDLEAQLEKSRADAIAADRAKSDFLANMSHEIRTPLGTLLGFSELMADNNYPESERRNFSDAIKRNGQLLSALIDDVLDLAKIEAGQIQFENTEVRLKEIFDQIHLLLEPRAKSRRVTLTSYFSPALPEVINTDPLRLKQILLNIVGNAVKFTEDGEVRVTVSGCFVDSARRKFELKIDVEDTGIGITAEQSARLFKPFAQADTSTTRRFAGTGLGLVLARKLSEHMNGNLDLLRSTPGQGSCFQIRVVTDVPQVSQSLGLPACEIKISEEHKRRVLLVDDSVDNQVLISLLLRTLGISVTTAGDGIEALEQARHNDFDLILMDVQMPRMGGLEATQTLRKDGYSRPIIALTAHALKEDRDRCLKAGFDDYLTKPVNRLHMLQRVDEILRQPPSHAR